LLLTMPIIIRAAAESDIAAMASLRAETWGSEEYWKARIVGYLSGEHSPQQALAARGAFVAMEENAVAGLIAGHRTKRFGYDGELEWIDVSKSRRGQGIADKLLVAISARFVEQSALRVCVNVAQRMRSRGGSMRGMERCRSTNIGWAGRTSARSPAARKTSPWKDDCLSAAQALASKRSHHGVSR
jgi:GNAT superfamily N-acetyltransferase